MEKTPKEKLKVAGMKEEDVFINEMTKIITVKNPLINSAILNVLKECEENDFLIIYDFDDKYRNLETLKKLAKSEIDTNHIMYLIVEDILNDDKELQRFMHDNFIETQMYTDEYAIHLMYFKGILQKRFSEISELVEKTPEEIVKEIRSTGKIKDIYINIPTFRKIAQSDEDVDDILEKILTTLYMKNEGNIIIKNVKRIARKEKESNVKKTYTNHVGR